MAGGKDRQNWRLVMIDKKGLDEMALRFFKEKGLDEFKTLDLELARVLWQQGFLAGAHYGIDEIGKVLPKEER